MRVLSADWVPTWGGWKDAEGDLTEFHGSEEEQKYVIRDCIRRFCRIVLDTPLLRAVSVGPPSTRGGQQVRAATVSTGTVGVLAALPPPKGAL